jgi:hypothetical protein
VLYRGKVVELEAPKYEQADKNGLLKLIELAHAKSVEICKTANRIFAGLQIFSALLLCAYLGVAAMSGQVQLLGLEIAINQEHLSTLAVVIISALYVMYIGAVSYFLESC